MPRHDYPLTDETRRVLDSHFKEIADEMGVSPQYIYGIVAGDNPDAFAYYKVIYQACVRAGADVTTWDTALSTIKARFRSEAPAKECLADKILSNAETTAKWVDAMQDGVITSREAGAIRRAIQKERDSLDALETLLTIREEKRDTAASRTAQRFSSVN